MTAPPAPALATSMTLFSPNGGETYHPGDQLTIEWTVPSSRVEFLNYAWSSDDGATWIEIEGRVSSAIIYKWTVPDLTTNAGRFRIEATDLAIVYAFDVSDAAFSIAGNEPPPGEETAAEGEDEKPAEPAAGVEVSDLPETAISQVTGFPEEVTPLTWGTFVRPVSLSTVYYLDPLSRTRRAILGEVILRTYGAKQADIHLVSDATLQFIALGRPFPPKAGTVLVKVTEDAQVYYLAVPTDQASDGILRHIVSESLAGMFFGAGWQKYVIDIPNGFLEILPFGAPMGFGDAVDLDLLKTREELTKPD